MIRKRKKALVDQKNLKKFSLLTNENINRGINVNKIMIGPLIKMPTAREVQKRQILKSFILLFLITSNTKRLQNVTSRNNTPSVLAWCDSEIVNRDKVKKNTDMQAILKLKIDLILINTKIRQVKIPRIEGIL